MDRKKFLANFGEKLRPVGDLFFHLSHGDLEPKDPPGEEQNHEEKLPGALLQETHIASPVNIRRTEVYTSLLTRLTSADTMYQTFLNLMQRLEPVIADTPTRIKAALATMTSGAAKEEILASLELMAQQIKSEDESSQRKFSAERQKITDAAEKETKDNAILIAKKQKELEAIANEIAQLTERQKAITAEVVQNQEQFDAEADKYKSALSLLAQEFSEIQTLLTQLKQEV